MFEVLLTITKLTIMNDKAVESALYRLKYLIATIPGLINQLSDAAFSFKQTPVKWSKKQILGHLIDSAANNHQRFIRIQYEQEPVFFYDQDEWNRLHHYNELDRNQLIRFWEIYNEHIMEVIKRILPQNLDRKGSSRNGHKQTLRWFIQDYVEHMEHHLKQIIDNY